MPVCQPPPIDVASEEDRHIGQLHCFVFDMRRQFFKPLNRSLGKIQQTVRPNPRQEADKQLCYTSSYTNPYKPKQEINDV